MINIMVMVQLEHRQRTHGKARKDGPPPNHICGVLVRYKDVITNVLLKKFTAKEWKAILLNERLSSWGMWWQIKLVDEHEECQGNPRGELALDSKRLRSLDGLVNYYHHFIRDFLKVASTLLNLMKKNDNPKCGMSLVTKPLGSSRASFFLKMWSNSRVFKSIFECT